MSGVDANEVLRVGLCIACRRHRLVVSGRGARFHMCELSKSDPAYPRYPPLPVLACAGYAPDETHVAGTEDL